MVVVVVCVGGGCVWWWWLYVVVVVHVVVCGGGGWMLVVVVYMWWWQLHVVVVVVRGILHGSCMHVMVPVASHCGRLSGWWWWWLNAICTYKCTHSRHAYGHRCHRHTGTNLHTYMHTHAYSVEKHIQQNISETHSMQGLIRTHSIVAGVSQVDVGVPYGQMYIIYISAHTSDSYICLHLMLMTSSVQ